LAAGGLGDGPARPVAAREGDASDAVVLDHCSDLVGTDQQRGERALGEASLLEDVLDGPRAAGDVRGVFQQTDVARGEIWGGKAEHLPEGEVPGHDRQYRPQRLVGDDRPRALVACDHLVLQVFGGDLGVVVTEPRALCDLVAGLTDGFPHLFGHQFGVVVLIFPQDLGRFRYESLARLDRRLAPLLEGLARPPNSFVSLLVRCLLEAIDHSSCCRIGTLNGHVATDHDEPLSTKGCPLRASLFVTVVRLTQPLFTSSPQQ